MTLKILILGANGFIGNCLTRNILSRTNWEIYGLDIDDHKLEESLNHPRFHFFKGDMLSNQKWIEDYVQKCDVVLPLVAIANPTLYVKDPLRVFQLDFEANLEVVKLCVQHKKRIIFPSTSEVYGMSQDKEFDEETTNFVLGPIHKQRWIYSCSKQLLDRVIYAYGIHRDLDYTLFRPFNWLGPKMDDVFSEKEGNSRAVIQFISNILYGRPIKLMDGGKQRRCFTDVEEGVDALMRMIENKDGAASKRIFNIGNPNNNLSMAEAAHEVVTIMKEYPQYKERAENAKIESVDSQKHFGTHYEDVQARVPAIKNAQTHLGWTPKTPFTEILRKTMDYHFIQNPGKIKV
jgi:nucleoside-diphosphate-sugar epimerase